MIFQENYCKMSYILGLTFEFEIFKVDNNPRQFVIENTLTTLDITFLLFQVTVTNPSRKFQRRNHQPRIVEFFMS